MLPPLPPPPCRRALALLLAALPACATLPTEGDDGHLPNAHAGPFREIDPPELGNSRTAPYAINDDDTFERDASVLDLDGDPATLAAAGFFAATFHAEGAPPDPLAPPTAIVRHEALDGRSFDRFPVPVLEPEAPWEGGTVGAPSALRAGGEIRLYYAAAGGIGLARSVDGFAFTREPGPVLAPDPGGWERGATPRSPGVAALPDGSFALFYEVATEGGATSLGEARSADGVTWRRVGGGPALAPSPPAAVEGDAAYDDAAVGDPAPVVVTSATGRSLLYVYYAARDRAGRLTIGLAARAGDAGPLQRGAAPVMGAASSLGPRAPWVNAYPDFTLLFATARAGSGDADAYPAVAVGVAPGDVRLPPPEPR